MVAVISWWALDASCYFLVGFGWLHSAKNIVKSTRHLQSTDKNYAKCITIINSTMH